MRRPFYRNKTLQLGVPGTIGRQACSLSMPMDYPNCDLRDAHLTMILEELDELDALARSITNPTQLSEVQNLIDHSRKMLSQLIGLFNVACTASGNVSNLTRDIQI